MGEMVVGFFLVLFFVLISSSIIGGTNSKYMACILLALLLISIFGGTVINAVKCFLDSRVRKYRKSFYSSSMLKNKSIINSKFYIDTQFEKDKNIFRNLKDSSLYKVSLPCGDYSIYDFSDVNLTSTCFTKDSILPNDLELFQKIKCKSLKGTILSEGDFRKYNFKDVVISETKFNGDSRLSDESDFFQRVANKALNGTVLPSFEARNLHLYNLNGIGFDKTFFKENNISKFQLLIIKNKKCKRHGRLEKSYF